MDHYEVLISIYAISIFPDECVHGPERCNENAVVRCEDENAVVRCEGGNAVGRCEDGNTIKYVAVSGETQVERLVDGKDGWHPSWEGGGLQTSSRHPDRGTETSQDSDGGRKCKVDSVLPSRLRRHTNSESESIR
jgi:hypothetical protein